MSQSNQTNSTVLQALLDLSALGYSKLSVQDIITMYNNNPSFRRDIEAKWHGHAYNDKKLTFAKCLIHQELFTLSAEGFMILSFMGMYCSHTGLIRVARNVLVQATGVSLTGVKNALKELLNCGAITIYKQSVRHSAPIYAVNPQVFSKSKRGSTVVKDFAGDIAQEDYLLNRKLDLIVQANVVKESDATYQDVILVTPEQQKTDNIKPSKPRRKKVDDSAPLDGQMELEEGA